MNFSPEQAQALFQAGGFILFTDLPEGAEFGIDGSHNLVKKFSGIKFLPPGLHLISWAPPNDGPSIRSGLVRFFRPKERYTLEYDPKTEDAVGTRIIVSEDHLKTLDKELAPYPFSEEWSLITSRITREVIEEVLPTGRLDSMTESLNFPDFDLKKSWREGAVGEEITRYSRDKSWLLQDVSSRHTQLLAYLQLSFILFLHLSSYIALTVYKRFLSLICQSSISNPKLHLDLIQVLTSQLHALPPTSFETELPEMDIFYLEQINSLREHLVASGTSAPAWGRLRTTAKVKFGWEIDDLTAQEEEEDEEGEYAPVVVEQD